MLQWKSTETKAINQQQKLVYFDNWLWTCISLPFHSANIYLIKVIIETLEKGVKFVQSQEWRHWNDVNVVVLVSLDVL